MITVDDNILKLSAKLWTQVSEFQQPADALLSKFFKENRKLRTFERNAIAETIYTILRNYYKLTTAIGTNPIKLVACAWVKLFKLSKSDWEKVTIIRHNDFAQLANFDYAKLELPEWIVARLSQKMTINEIIQLDQAMSSMAPLTVRVNTVKISRNDLLAKFAEQGIQAESTKHSPYGIKLANKASLMQNQLFSDGCFEVQDEASQLSGILLNAKRSEMVVDFCAGSGGKTLLLGMMMRNSGRIYAFDVNDRRLSNLAPRLARSGLSNVYPQLISHENDTRVKRLAGKIDKVFVDAPCLGLGTIRRNPDLKFRQTEQSLEEINAKQHAILKSASRLVKAGGYILYATCSILAEENQKVIEKFLAENDEFSIVNLHEFAESTGLTLADERYLELFPHIHNTDGFFACLLQKKINQEILSVPDEDLG